jgi:hypothetical protein
MKLISKTHLGELQVRRNLLEDLIISCLPDASTYEDVNLHIEEDLELADL